MLDDVLVAVEAITRGECVLCAGSRLDGALGEPPAPPAALASLPFRAVLTTGRGEVIERAFAPRPVVRLLGAIASVRELFLATTFVFVGFERGDPDLALLLDHILVGLRGQRPHLALIPALTRAERDELLARYDLRVLDGDLGAFLDAVARGFAESPYEQLTISDTPEPEPERGVPADGAPEGSPDDRLAGLLDEAEAEPDPARRSSLLAEVARVFEEECADPERAFTALVAGFRLAASGRVAERLVRLADATGRWEELAEELAGAAARAQDLRVVGRIHLLLGRLEEERLARPAAALDSYRRAVAADPRGEEAWEALEALARRRADGRAILDALDGAGVAPVSAVARYRALHADAPNDIVVAAVLAELCRRAGDLEGAVRAYQAILAVEAGRLDAAPERLNAAHALAELLDAAGRDEELVPILELLARGELDREARVRCLRRLARAAAALGDEERRFDALARAAALAPDDADVLREHGAALFLRGRFAEALAALGRAFERRCPNLPAGDERELRSLLGRAALRAGRRDQARLHLDAALRIDSEHAPSLIALLEAGDLPADREIACRRALVRQLPDDERFDHIVKIGDRFLQDLDDQASALAAWRAALELRPEDHRLLHRCLDVFVDQRRWDAAVETLDRLIAAERVAARRIPYRVAAAAIARDELADPEAALRYLTAAVDDDPTHERAVRSLERLLEGQERWRDLERHYARAIARLGPEAPDGRNAERVRLWSALARLCLARPELEADAAVAFDVAHQVRERSGERLD